MKLVIAMDSFKGTLGSLQAGETVKAAFCEVFPATQVEVCVVSDGGEGTVDALMQNLNGEYRQKDVTGPFGKTVQATYGISGELAVIEMAEASGITLAETSALNPLTATTYGTGQLILDALDRGAKKIILGIGGSATNDGGAGMAQALGVSFLDGEGEEIGFGGGELRKIRRIDTAKMDPRVRECGMLVACDVTNPLCGAEGASHVYGPQKGATPGQVIELDRALAHFAGLVEGHCGRDYAHEAGAGAAGGLGFALMAFCGAEVKPGIGVVLDAIQIEEKMRGADLVVTGEGCMDAQAAHGKAPAGVAERAKKQGIPVIAIVGQTKPGFEAVYDLGIDAVIPCVNRTMTFEEVKREAGDQLRQAALLAARLLRVGGGLSAL